MLLNPCIEVYIYSYIYSFNKINYYYSLGWFKAYGVASFVTSIVGNGVNMYMLIKFIYSYKSDDGVNQFLFTQFVKLILCWIKTHLVAVLIEFFMVFIRGIYDYTSKNTNKQSLPESADAYQPGTADLEKIKQYYNGSVKVKIERLHVEVMIIIILLTIIFINLYNYY